MSRVHFHAGEVDLELTGSEAFVVRQLKILSPLLGEVDAAALPTVELSPKPPLDEPPEADAGDGNGDAKKTEVPLAVATDASAAPEAAEEEPKDELMRFFRAHPPTGPDPQAEAALLFAYYLQRKEGLRALQLSDLIRCCIRAGVDTRNFNRTLGALSRRGFLETVRHGHAYRLSEQGAAVVESRL